MGTTRKRIQAKIDELQSQLANLPEIDPHWPGMLRPKVGQTVYTPNSSGIIIGHNPIEGVRKKLKHTSTCSATRAEGEFVEEYLTAKFTLIELLLDFNEEDTDWINWSDRSQSKWQYGWDYLIGKYFIHNSYFQQYTENWFYAKSKEIWEEVVGTLGVDQVNLALFPHYKETNE